MVQRKNCRHVRHIAAGDTWYCSFAADETSRGPGSGEIQIEDVIYPVIFNVDKEVDCDHFMEKEEEE